MHYRCTTPVAMMLIWHTAVTAYHARLATLALLYIGAYPGRELEFLKHVYAFIVAEALSVKLKACFLFCTWTLTLQHTKCNAALGSHHFSPNKFQHTHSPVSCAGYLLYLFYR